MMLLFQLNLMLMEYLSLVSRIMFFPTEYSIALNSINIIAEDFNDNLSEVLENKVLDAFAGHV